MEKITIVKSFERKIKKFRMLGQSLVFKINTAPKNENPVEWVKDALQQVVTLVTKGVDPSDKIGFTFDSGNFERGQGWLNFKDASEVAVDDVWGALEKIFQSNSKGLDTDMFTVTVTTIKMPKGCGRREKKAYNTFQEECNARSGIVTIINKDNLCLPRALVVGMAYATKDPKYNKIRDSKKIQKEKAEKVCVDADVVIGVEGAGIPEIIKFQEYLKNYKISVYDYSGMGKSLLFEGPDAPLKINLLYHEGHFNLITSLTSAFACSYYCEACHMPYDHKDKHRCGGTCPACQQSPACPLDVKISCDECNRWFRSNQCFEHHKKSVCSQISACPHCLKTIKGGRTHTCGEIYCKICEKHQPSPHLCYMRPAKPYKNSDSTLFVFYDLETRQDKKIDESSSLHIPTLCVFRQVCSSCITENKFLYCCQQCGICLQKLTGDKIIDIFMSHLLNIRKKFKKVVVIAHNGQAFDHQFILNHILTKTSLTPDLIMRGTKIISMELVNVKFIDSLNYFPMALSKLPKAFGLGDNFKKGYFPHLFNSLENQHYVGPMPDISYYDPDNMKTPDREQFLEWYSSHVNDIFDMQKEIIEYCVSDVEILAAACLKFRSQMLETGNVDPFLEASTIASTCNKVFRRNFLKTDTVGIIPKGGYRLADNQSKIALQWLIWEEKQREINILHAAKQNEVVLHGNKVDGFCPDTNQVFEFHGCYFHGCPNCFKHDRDKSLNDGASMNTRYESTFTKIDKLKKFGYEVIERWECSFRKQLTDSEVADYTENHPLLINTPLNPRDAFFGGRTGNTRLYYKTREDEKIKYLDVCSLYPWVCKYGKYPIGHPKVRVGPECPEELGNVEGLIKCKILPPRDKYHPVLPLKANNKLLFPLCRTCALRSCTICDHDEEQRALIGTWVMDEVIKAVELGYTILKIYEIWDYNTLCYDSDKRTGGLFTDMMDRFLKIKQQASGWPKNCNSIEEKEVYIEKFSKYEGIKLEFSDIVENPGLRALAKLILNSFWGKLGQRENQPKTKIVNKPDEFFAMLCDPNIEINTVLPINDETLIVNYEFKEESYDQLPTVNVCLAAYTTAQARLKLYSYLEQLGDRVLYYDTDSVIFISRKGEPEPETGECVGELTDELECYGPGSFITEFVCAGPKSYAYRVYSPSQDKYFDICKVKGISLNYETSKIINFEKIRDMVMNEEAPVNIVCKNIERTNMHDVITKETHKFFQINSRKRVFEGLESVPFGYKRIKQ